MRRLGLTLATSSCRLFVHDLPGYPQEKRRPPPPGQPAPRPQPPPRQDVIEVECCTEFCNTTTGRCESIIR